MLLQPLRWMPWNDEFQLAESNEYLYRSFLFLVLILFLLVLHSFVEKVKFRQAFLCRLLASLLSAY